MTVSICAGPTRSTGVLPRSRSSHRPRRVATTSHPATENTSVSGKASAPQQRDSPVTSQTSGRCSGLDHEGTPTTEPPPPCAASTDADAAGK